MKMQLEIGSIRASSSDHQLFIRIEPLERLDEQLGTLLWNQTTQEQEVIPF